jgi:S-methylmethionine-dependent homocysteine/selenocysteine methylase
VNRPDELLYRHGLVVLDGGLATELERRGPGLRDPLWSARVLVEAPELIRQVHLDCCAAGADVATTASCQVSFEGLARRGLDAAAAAAVMRRAVTLACEARAQFWGDPAARAGRSFELVAASIGPYGATLHDGSDDRGHYRLDVDALVDFHRPRPAELATADATLALAELASDRYRLGARLIGGCCRTTPADICALRARLDEIAQGRHETGRLHAPVARATSRAASDRAGDGPHRA